MKDNGIYLDGTQQSSLFIIYITLQNYITFHPFNLIRYDDHRDAILRGGTQ